MDNSIPFSIDQGEEIKCLQDNVNLNIKYADDNIYILNKGIFCLTTQRIIYCQKEPRKICLYIPYQNCITHGINKTDLYCIISDLLDTQDNAYDNDEDDMEEEDEDPVIEKLKIVDGFDDESLIKLIGHYEIVFDFKDTLLQKLDEVFKVFSECSALNPDENTNQQDQMNFLDNEFITAKDIDENGNVILGQGAGNDDNDDDEDDDDGDYVNGDGGDNANNNNNNNNGKMDGDKMDLE